MRVSQKMVFYEEFYNLTSVKKMGQKASFKKGFSLIELVLAIVVVGITLAALPSIVFQTQKSNELAIKQELTYNAKTLMGRIISMPWDSIYLLEQCKHKDIGNFDERSCLAELDKDSTSNGRSARIQDKIVTFVEPIYNLSLADKNSDQRPGTGLALNGDPLSQYKRKVLFTPTLPGDFTNKSYGYAPGKNDMDDFNGASGNFLSTMVLGNDDFLSDMYFQTQVFYIDNSLVKDAAYSTGKTQSLKLDDSTRIYNATTNIKKVEVAVYDAKDVKDANYYARLVYYAPNIGNSRSVEREWK